MTAEERRVAELELDVDVRLTDVWVAVMELEGTNVLDAMLEDDDVRAAFAAFLRVAYSVGYNDALREAVDGRAAELHRRHGYEAPI